MTKIILQSFAFGFQTALVVWNLCGGKGGAP